MLPGRCRLLRKPEVETFVSVYCRVVHLVSRLCQENFNLDRLHVQRAKGLGRHCAKHVANGCFEIQADESQSLVLEPQSDAETGLLGKRGCSDDLNTPLPRCPWGL